MSVARRVTRTLGGLIASLTLLTPVQAVDDFNLFWKDFRQAVMDNDGEQLIELTAFPFKTRGALDEEPSRTYDIPAFNALMPRLLAEDSGQAADPIPMQHYIEQIPAFPSPKPPVVRVGQFVFNVVKGRWAFTLAYVGDE